GRRDRAGAPAGAGGAGVYRGPLRRRPGGAGNGRTRQVAAPPRWPPGADHATPVGAAARATRGSRRGVRAVRKRPGQGPQAVQDAAGLIALSQPLFCLNEHAVLVGSAEIHVHGGDALAPESQEFGVAIRLAVGRGAAVSDERLVAFDENAFDVLVAAGIAVGPAALEVSRLVDGVVIGAGEGEIVREQRLGDIAIFRFVGAEIGAHDIRQFSVLHGRL